MFRQEDRSQTENRRHVPLRVQGASVLLGTLRPLFDRHGGSYATFSKSMDHQLAELEQRWSGEGQYRANYITFLSEMPAMPHPKPK